MMKWLTLLALGVAIAALAAGCNLTQNPPIPTLRPSIAPPLPGPGVAGTVIPSVTPLNLNPPTAIPQGGGTVGSGTGNGCVVPVGWVPYVIEAGDTVGLLAEATGTTAEALAAANCLSDPSLITVGQQFYLPTDPVVG